ncbi:hypothetical protein GZL_05225 [Streptomyces sp. 769]|nr:hypothetical protein GZL_05225 [Streptomyces sp. 769]
MLKNMPRARVGLAVARHDHDPAAFPPGERQRVTASVTFHGLTSDPVLPRGLEDAVEVFTVFTAHALTVAESIGALNRTAESLTDGGVLQPG